MIPQAKKVNVMVAQRHIDAGVPVEPHACPITLAIKEQVPEFSHVWTFPHGVSILDETTKHLMLTARSPFKMRKWVNAYDKGDPVAPISFDLLFTPFRSEVTTRDAHKV